MKTILLFFITLFLFHTIYAASPRTAAAMVDGVSYKAILNGDNSLSIKAGNKTVFYAKRADLYVTFESFQKLEFEDFNGDGYADLIVSYFSNVPGKQDLILYNKHTKKFVLVNGFPDYPSSVHIAPTAFYYSYHRSGCADLDWDSDLYKIANYKIIPAGNIAGRQCENSGEKLGIFINKVTGKKQHLIKKYTPDALNGDKSNFIDQYWKANYSRF
jgi:hypothetical protein